MNNPLQKIALLCTCLLGTAIAAEPPEAKVAAKKKVMSVEEVTVRAAEGKPTQITIEAAGMVNSGGWSKPVLRPVKSAVAGTLAFEFVASAPPPDAIVTQALVTLKANITVDKPANYTGVEVSAQRNSKTAK